MTLAFNENVTVKGRPRLNLGDGVFADYASGSGTSTLVFREPQGKSTEVASVDLNGGAIIATEADATLRLAQLTLPDVAKNAVK